MPSFFQALEDLLPLHLQDLLKWEFIPWSHVKYRHSDLAGPPLTALLGAYSTLNSHFDLKTISSQDLPEENWGCMRCGFCCTSRRPGPVTAATYRNWEKAGAPVALFYKVRGRKKRNPVYSCWFHNGIRLRICPFLLMNLTDHKPFCSIYHTGDDYRPFACSGYVPRHETCTVNTLEIIPWESC
jgi:hypothetical protein